jgi:hypothetical protein
MEYVEREPKGGSGWTRIGYIAGARATGWVNGKTRVLSALDDTPVGKQWVVSVTGMVGGGAPLPREVKRALVAFGMTEAAEVKGHGTVARRFQLVCDPKMRDILPRGAAVLTATPVAGTLPESRSDLDCVLCRRESHGGLPCRVHRPGIAPRSALVSGLVRP